MAQHGKRIAVVENEFGEVGIDDALLRRNMKQHSQDEIIEMMNGCICCTVRADLVVVLKKLRDRHRSGQTLDAIIIETTGLADPGPVAQTFFAEDDVADFCKLDSIVTMVDANYVVEHLDEQKPEGVENEAVEQVAFADRLLVNKIDLVREEKLALVESRLRAINKFAPIIRCENATVDIGNVLNIGAFDLKRTLATNPEFLNTDGEHGHDASVTSLGIDVKAEVDLALFQEWLRGLLKDTGADTFRIKGVLAIADVPDRYVYHAVHRTFSGRFMEEWGDDETRFCKLTFIGRNLNHDELRAGFVDCLATEANYKKRVASLRFRIWSAVECRTRTGWVEGTIIKLLYREDNSPPGFLAPYQIEIDECGTLIYAPVDDDSVIRKPATGVEEVALIVGEEGSDDADDDDPAADGDDPAADGDDPAADGDDPAATAATATDLEERSAARPLRHDEVCHVIQCFDEDCDGEGG